MKSSASKIHASQVVGWLRRSRFVGNRQTLQMQPAAEFRLVCIGRNTSVSTQAEMRPLPRFFVSVASKGFTFTVSCLESTLSRWSCKC
jgi:hypothetical protein